MRLELFVLPVVLLLATSALAAPDTVASVRSRAHKEIAARDVTIVSLQQKIAAQQKEIDALHTTFAEALQQVKKVRAAMTAAGIVVPSDGSTNPLDLTFPAPTDATQGLADQSVPAAISLPYAPPITPQTYRYIPPSGGVPSSLMPFERIVDRYVKLHPEVITSALMHHGRIEWVKVVDAERSTSVAYPYTVSAQVEVIYPSDPSRGENIIYKTIERPTFQVNLATGEVGGKGEF